MPAPPPALRAAGQRELASNGGWVRGVGYDDAVAGPLDSAALDSQGGAPNIAGLSFTNIAADGGSLDLQLQSIAHGVLRLQNLEQDFGITRRRLAPEWHVIGAAYRRWWLDGRWRSPG